MTTRFGLGASVSKGPGGLGVAGEGEGNVATSASLCSSCTGGSFDSLASGVIAGASVSGSPTAVNCGIAVEVVSPKHNQSCGGVMMPQTFAGLSSSTPTCCSSRVLCDA